MTLDPLEAERINSRFAANCGYDNVKDWLFGLGLGQYFEWFIDNGYDSFRICSVIKKIDIETLGITDPYHIELLIKGVERLNNPKASSVYYRLSISKFDDNDIRSNSGGELTNSNSVHSEATLTNGVNSHKITETYYLKKPTLTEKRLVRTRIVQMQVDLADTKYDDNSLHLDALAENISEQLELDELHVYDILCQLRGITQSKSSPAVSKRQVAPDSNGNGESAYIPLSPEDVFSPVNNLPTSAAVYPPKPFLRPKKPPRSFRSPEEKFSQSSPVHLMKSNSEVTSSASSICLSTSEPPEPTADSAYDILHSDSSDPIIMSTGKSPTKVKTPTKSDKTIASPPPPPALLPSVSCSTFTEEPAYTLLEYEITENNIGPPARSKSINPITTSSIFKRKALGKKQHTIDEQTQNPVKKPPSQPPPPPPVSTMPESENSSKRKPEKSRKHSHSTSHFYTNEVEVDNTITEPCTASKTKKENKKTVGIFRKSAKPKSDVKKSKKSKDESDLQSMKGSNEENSRPISKIHSKSSDNLYNATIDEEIKQNEENNVNLSSPKNTGILPVQSNDDIPKRKLASEQPLKSNVNERDPFTSLPLPLARKRNSPDESAATLLLGCKPNNSKEDRSLFCSQTLPRIATTPPPKPKRHISTEEALYDNIEQPNPAPRVKKSDSPLTSIRDCQNSVTQRSQLPDVVAITSEKPPQTASNDSQSSAIPSRIKPNMPKGKKPALKKKPSKDCIHVREKSNGDIATAASRETKSKSIESLSVNFGSSMKRVNSPLIAPPFPTTKRPENPPEPPPIHLIPSLRPVAHVRPTKPPIITPPCANTSSPIAEPRNPDNWKRIEEKIYSILKEEDFLEYLITHYTGENGESKISAGLLSRLADETSLAIHHIASAVDNIRLSKLIEQGRPAVAISLHEFDSKDPSIKTDTVSNWLTSIGLPCYIEVFYENLKSTDEIKDLDPDDLIDYGVLTKHRGYLYSAIEMLQSSNSK